LYYERVKGEKMGYLIKQKCINCGKEYPPDEWIYKGCEACKTENFVSNVVSVYDIDGIAEKVDKKTLEKRKDNTMWKYKEFLPVENEKNIVSLGEGSTPLVKCEKTGEYIGVKNFYVKNESVNPTWSFKDRLCSSVVSKALEMGFKTVTISTSGNHGASTAAYASKAGMNSVIFTFKYTSPAMKVSMEIYHPMLIATSTSIERWILMNECIEKYGWALTGDYVHLLDNGKFLLVGSNPFAKDGYKTIAYEICEQLEWEVPDWVAQPTCYANGLVGEWEGFKEFKSIGFVDSTPKMIAAERFGILEKALEKGENYPRQIEPQSSIALSIAGFLSTYQGLYAIKESNGRAVSTEDEELLKMQSILGKDGIFPEASSAASVAAVKRLKDEGSLDAHDTVVAVITGSGLKDISPTEKYLSPIPVIKPKIEELKKTLFEVYNYRL